MKFYIIEGNVVGGHEITDLGVTVPYKEKIHIPLDRAGWSRDLTQALSKGSVVKHGVSERPSLHLSIPPSKPVIESEIPPPRKVPQEKSEVELLREQNDKLVTMLETLASQQGSFLESMQKGVIAVSPSQPTNSKVLQGSAPPSSPSLPEVDDDWDIEDEPIFIPSQIRKETTKISEDIAVEEIDADAGDRMEKATELLSGMAKKRRKK